jgi:hypothetical protein
MRIARVFILVGGLTTLLGIAADLHGQGLAPGSVLRLRLKDDAQPVIYGTLSRVQRDTIFLRGEFDSTYTLSTVPLRKVAQVDVYQGTHGHAKAGALIGLGIGAAAGAAVFVGLNQGCCFGGGSSSTSDAGAGVFGAFLGGAAGAGAGALIGWVIARGETWKTVPLTTFQVAPVSLGRVGFRVSVSF